MSEFWEDIEGWFNFYDLYLEMIERFDNAVFVEIGCYKGRSTGFMALNIKKSKKNIKFYGIDIFVPYLQSGGDAPVGEPWYDEFIENMEPVKEYVNVIKGDSHEVHAVFRDKSIDFIYIDACHDYEAVLKDLQCWYPKLKEGGVMAGHDYQWSGVEKAVNEFFADKGYTPEMIEASGSWIINR